MRFSCYFVQELSRKVSRSRIIQSLAIASIPLWVGFFSFFLIKSHTHLCKILELSFIAHRHRQWPVSCLWYNNDPRHRLYLIQQSLRHPTVARIWYSNLNPGFFVSLPHSGTLRHLSLIVKSMTRQVRIPYEPGHASGSPALIPKYRCLLHVGTLHSLRGDI